MDSQSLSTENNFNPSIIHNDPPCSRADRLNELKEPLLAQPQDSSAGDPKVEGSKDLLERVKEIDEKLGRGRFFFAYELWLFFVVIAVSFKGGILCFLVYHFWFWNTLLAQMCSVLLIFTFYYIFWTIQQALLQGKALWEKNHEIATKAYSSLLRLAAYYFVLYVAFLMMSIFWRYCVSGGGAYLWHYINELLEIFVPLYVIPVPISIFGSYKMKVLLEEKMSLLSRAGKGNMNESKQMKPQRIFL